MVDSIYDKKISFIKSDRGLENENLLKTFSLFLTQMCLPTVKISAKSMRSIEQGFAGTGHGLCAMPPTYV
jgi:hypothetical protein